MEARLSVPARGVCPGVTFVVSPEVEQWGADQLAWPPTLRAGARQPPPQGGIAYRREDADPWMRWRSGFGWGMWSGEGGALLGLERDGLVYAQDASSPPEGDGVHCLAAKSGKPEKHQILRVHAGLSLRGGGSVCACHAVRRGARRPLPSERRSIAPAARCASDCASCSTGLGEQATPQARSWALYLFMYSAITVESTLEIR